MVNASRPFHRGDNLNNIDSILYTRGRMYILGAGRCPGFLSGLIPLYCYFDFKLNAGILAVTAVPFSDWRCSYAHYPTTGHEISGIASHFAMHILRFASQLHVCIANFAMQYS